MTEGDLVRAGRTLAAMTRDEQMISEFVGGTPVPQIAARYGVAEDYVDRVIEEATATTEKPKRRRWDWSLNPLGNRILYSVLAALFINVVTGTALGWVVGVVLLILTSAIVGVARR
jgi:hypothetical protein